ncbi:uncharacterized protein LOC121873623 isoform X2 [Homarus americanus]|nr:uncharacterized protein LOC121873623 isoform X2 [Homarus americanus]XP_042233202.1 uncharacterized protein LOC121873623 isoform X2 [Homarus americanus]XP_042233203.1 uncharacterized protein LOC121873623 isoform X2 [Homarus americanus]
MIKNSQFTCPNCRADHNTLAVTDVTQLPINYGMESLIRRLKGVSFKPAQTKAPTKPPQDGPKGISKKFRSLLQEQKNNISSLITACDEKLSQLGKYGKKVKHLKTEHNLLEDRLNGLLEQNKAAKELVEQEETSVEDMSTKGEEGKQQLQAVLECLETVNSAQEVVMAIDDADQRSVVTEDWIQKCQEQFPNVNTVHTSVKVQESIGLALEMIPTEAAATAAPLHLGDSASTIMEKFDEITTNKLTVDDLGRMTEGVKRQVEAGRVYAVHQDQHGLRSSRITTQYGRLYLHTLQSQPAPLHAHTIQFTDFVGALDCSSTLVFLDLGWAGSTRGRVHIRLSPDTPRGRQFTLLCTGQRGHTYANTNFLKVCNKGREGECVVGGDYQYNDGKGGAPLLPDLQGDYRVSGSAGDVGCCYGGDTRGVQFSISTRYRSSWLIEVFGKVESGLEVVKAAVNHSNIREVTVVDCGVVLTI